MPLSLEMPQIVNYLHSFSGLNDEFKIVWSFCLCSTCCQSAPFLQPGDFAPVSIHIFILIGSIIK